MRSVLHFSMQLQLILLVCLVLQYMQAEPTSKTGNLIEYYVKGSGTSACLLTGKLDDEAQFISFSIKQMQIIHLQLSGLFALAVVQQAPGSEQNMCQTTIEGKINRKLIKWGNLNEQLRHEPQIIQLKAFRPVNLINCGWNHALLTTEDCILLGMGENKYGQLGIHNGNKFLHQVVSVIENQKSIVNVIAAGFRQSYWVTDQNLIFGCGQSKNNQLGKISKKQTLSQTKLLLQQNNARIVKISCGKKFAVILTQKGETYALGSNDYQCFSSSNQVSSFDKFTKIGQNIQDVECGWSHMVVLDKQGTVRSRGRNNFGQLGRSSLGEQDKVQIGQYCLHIKVGTQFNFAKGQSGKLYGWGWNQHLNIVNKSQSTIIQSPVIVETPPGFQLISCFTYPAITVIKGLQAT